MKTPFLQLTLCSVEHVWVKYHFLYHVAESRKWNGHLNTNFFCGGESRPICNVHALYCSCNTIPCSIEVGCDLFNGIVWDGSVLTLLACYYCSYLSKILDQTLTPRCVCQYFSSLLHFKKEKRTKQNFQCKL
jgi:hypothetical protein